MPDYEEKPAWTSARERYQAKEESGPSNAEVRTPGLPFGFRCL
jgi:hypothetical protein